MRSKNGEAKRVKALSQVILEQRSDVEQFFLEALEQIKEEIRKKIAIERKQRKVGGGPQQQLSATGSQMEGAGGTNDGEEDASATGNQPTKNNTQSKSYAEKVDLNDLDWEDRERVLRLLFSKMNAGVAPNLINIDRGAAANHQAKTRSIQQEQYPAIQYGDQ
jgi:hypothetical protein